MMRKWWWRTSLDGSWLLGILIAVVVVILRRQGESWVRIIGKVALVVAVSGLAVLLLLVGVRLIS
jgi:hypothetical protein